MNKLLILLPFLLISCGGKGHSGPSISEIKEEYEKSIEHLNNKVDELNLRLLEIESLQGYYYFSELGGEIEIIQDKYGRYDIRSFDPLTSINPENGTNAMHPNINRGDEFPREDGSISFSIDVNYTSGNDIEQDISGSNITGKKRTDFLFEKIDGKLKVTIKIFSAKKNDNTNYIIATRTFEGEE